MRWATGSLTPAKTIGIVRVSRWTGNDRRGPGCHDDVGLQTDQLLRERWYPIGVIAPPPKVRPHVAAIGPTQVGKRLRERRDARLHHGLVFVAPHEHADAPYYAVALLRPRRKRPSRRAAEPSDELAPPNHSITSSARSIIDGGMASPSALAVLRFRTIMNFVGNCTGRSLGFAPRRMRSTYEAARRQMSTGSNP
jgi:hypothetical protein